MDCWRGKNHVLAWQLDPVHLIWTTIGMDMVFDPKNKPTDFFIFLKIQDGGLRSKEQNRPNFTPQIIFRLGIWIPFIGFVMNILIELETSLRKNFSFISKSKMAAGGQKLIFDKISAQKSHFGLANGSRSSDLDKIWQEHTNRPWNKPTE